VTGNKRGSVGSNSGILDEELLPENLKQARFIANLVEKSGLPFAVSNPDGSLGMYNPAFLELTGYDAEEIKGIHWTSVPLTSPEWFETEDKALAELETTGKPVRYQKDLIRKDGKRIPVEVWANILRGGGGKGYRYAFVTDITERKQAELALKESREQYRALVDNANEAIVVTQDGKLQFVNRTVFELFPGYSEQELTGRPFTDFVHADDRARMLENLRKRLNSEPTSARNQYRLIMHDGAVKWAEIGTALIEWNHRPATLNFISDITQRKLADEEILRLSRLYRVISLVNQTVVRASNAGRLFADICDIVVEQGVFKLAWIGRLDPSSTQVIPIASAGAVDYIKDIQIFSDGRSEEHGPVGTAVREQKPVIQNDFTSGENAAEWQARAAGFGFHGAAAFPVTVDSLPWGALAVYSDVAGYFGDQETELLAETAGDIGFALDNLEREQKRERAESSLKKALDDTINVLAMTVEIRDPYTAGHQNHVSLLASRIAVEMGLPASWVEGIRIAGLVHDVGKMYVPSEILSKPGHLSDIEFSMIKTHPQAGYDILKIIDMPWPIAQAVLQHHERMDGSGYPSHLSDKDIVLEARILAVADVVEAIASHRPYRAALGIDKALEEISLNRGVLYDPDVVDACLRLFNEKGFKLH
jgi:PAS domain S-box-containing protein